MLLEGSAVYGELRSLAYFYLTQERHGHTLQPTALVHEALLRLHKYPSLNGRDRHELVRLAAQTMRRVLVDYARARRSLKRGGGMTRVSLDETLAEYEVEVLDLLAVDEALASLGGLDARMARVVELRFFAGLSEIDTADVLGVSVPTVRREWRLARQWLYGAMVGRYSGDA